MAFLEARFKEHSQRQDHINHYIFTDSDVAIIDDLGQLFITTQILISLSLPEKQRSTSEFRICRGFSVQILAAEQRDLLDKAFLEEIRGASVLFLPCAIYNWRPPEGAGKIHGMPLDVKVVHFKRSRKWLMLESWNFFNSSASSDISDMLCLILKSGRTKYDFYNCELQCCL
ncbi:hypothetical protein HHK36_019620 [Tetracentron sinense]|uniref:Uncharacterized protein n=1 Tax=Tetracentron sinense TaxID=13715 RepID=A0A834YXV2_TETSI|nr:hypothetical protein HHK36_019620 [Tetracentron sinense]